MLYTTAASKFISFDLWSGDFLLNGRDWFSQSADRKITEDSAYHAVFGTRYQPLVEELIKGPDGSLLAPKHNAYKTQRAILDGTSSHFAFLRGTQEGTNKRVRVLEMLYLGDVNEGQPDVVLELVLEERIISSLRIFRLVWCPLLLFERTCRVSLCICEATVPRLAQTQEVSALNRETLANPKFLWQIEVVSNSDGKNCGNLLSPSILSLRSCRETFSRAKV